MTPTPVAPETKMTVTLEAQHWNTVMAAVHELPWRIANALVQNMTEQLQGQTMQPPVTGNGLDLAAPLLREREGEDHDRV